MALVGDIWWVICTSAAFRFTLGLKCPPAILGMPNVNIYEIKTIVFEHIYIHIYIYVACQKGFYLQGGDQGCAFCAPRASTSYSGCLFPWRTVWVGPYLPPPSIFKMGFLNFLAKKINFSEAHFRNLR